MHILGGISLFFSPKPMLSIYISHLQSYISFYLHISLSIYISLFLSTYLSFYLHIFLSIYILHISLSISHKPLLSLLLYSHYLHISFIFYPSYVAYYLHVTVSLFMFFRFAFANLQNSDDLPIIARCCEIVTFYHTFLDKKCSAEEIDANKVPKRCWH